MKNYFQAPWSLKNVITSISISIVSLIIMIFTINIFFSEEEFQNLGLWGIEFTFFLQWALILTPIIFLTARKHLLKWEHFGFKKISVWEIIKAVAFAYLAYLGITVIIYWLIFYTHIEIPGYQVQEKILPLFGSDTFSIIVAGITIVLLAPLVEEIVFRGFIFRTLANKIGMVLGSIITALLFSLVHFPWTSVIPIFILGLILNSLVANTKSLWPAIVFHIFNNLIAFTIEVLIIKDVISVEDFV